MKKRGGTVIIAVIVIVLILAGGIGTYLIFENSKMCCGPPQETNFQVNYYAKYSSSGGDRILDIAYYVREGVIVSCEGTYSSPPSSEQIDAGILENNVEQCEIQKLDNGGYNVPLELITSISKDQKRSDEVRDGPSIYRYQIIDYRNAGEGQKNFSSLEGRVSVVTSEGYTYYDAENNIVSVQVKRDPDEGVMNRIKIFFSFGGSDFSSLMVAPKSGQSRVYLFNLSEYSGLRSVGVAPIFAVENKEKEGSIISEVAIEEGKVVAGGGSLGSVYNLGTEHGLESCLEAYEAGSKKDGTYEIDPDGLGGGEDPFEVYCDMTTVGGG